MRSLVLSTLFEKSVRKRLREKKPFLALTCLICVFTLHVLNPVFPMKSEKEKEVEEEEAFLSSSSNNNNDPFYPPGNLSAQHKASLLQNLPVPLQEAQMHLHDALLQSLHAREDPWSKALQEIKQAFQEASPEIRAPVHATFPNLLKPSLSLWPPHLLRSKNDVYCYPALTPDHPTFERLQEVIQNLKQLEGTVQFPSSLLSHLQKLRGIYQTYIESICQSASLERSLLLSPIRFKTEFSDQMYLMAQGTANALLSVDSVGIQSKKNQTGSSSVAHVGFICAKQNLIKQREGQASGNTLNPSMEWAMSAFHRLLFGNGLVPSAVVHLMHVPFADQLSEKKALKQRKLRAKLNEPGLSGIDRKLHQARLKEDLTLKATRDSLLQITPYAAGELLGDFLTRAFVDGALFETVDLRCVQELILSSLLTNPTDAKGDNLVVMLGEDGKRRIVGIDNDLALSSFIVQEKPGYHFLETRHLLFVIPQFMEAPLADSVRTRFLAHTPASFLLTWLKALASHEAYYSNVFDPYLVSDLLTLRLQLGTLQTLFKNFQTLQYHLRNAPDMTCQRLFKVLSPLSARTYKKLRDDYPPLHAFDLIYRQALSLEKIWSTASDKVIQDMLEREHISESSSKARTQTLSGAALELFNAIDLNTLRLSERVRFVQEARAAFPDAVKVAGHSSWQASFLQARNTEGSLSPSETSIQETQPTRNPLHEAAQRGDTRELTLLLEDPEMCAQLNALNPQGWAPLHIAAAYGRLDTVSLLLDKGAEINRPSKTGMTALHMSAQGQRKEVCRLLLERGAFFRTGDREGKTAFDLAEERNAQTVLQVFEEHESNEREFLLRGERLKEARWKRIKTGACIGGGTSTLCLSVGTGLYFIFRPECAAEVNLADLSRKNGFKVEGISNYQVGISVSGAGDINEDGVDDIIIGANQAGSGGAVYVIFGNKTWPSVFPLQDNLDGTNGFILTGSRGEQAGTSVSRAGDVNGDGIDDVIIGAPYFNQTTGASYVVFGHKRVWDAKIPLSSLNGTNGFTLAGILPNDAAGNSVSSAGDFNGDKIADIAISAPRAPNNKYIGATYVVFGHKGPWPVSLSLGSLDGMNGVNFTGAGYVVSNAGDINKDNISDIIIGWPYDGSGGYEDAGAAYVAFGHKGPWPAVFNLSSLNGTNGFNLKSIMPNENSGRSVSGAGDVNGDGIDDIVIGAPGSHNEDNNGQPGTAYVIFGKENGWSATIPLGSLRINGSILHGVTADDRTGWSVSGIGDVNNDTFDDLLIGSPYNNNKVGASYVVFGKKDWNSETSLNGLNGANGFSMTSTVAAGQMGYSVRGAGDINKDNITDIIIGALFTNNKAGAAYVVFGQKECIFLSSSSSEEESKIPEETSKSNFSQRKKSQLKFEKKQYLLKNDLSSSSAPYLEPLWINFFTTTFQAISSTLPLLPIAGGNTEQTLAEGSSSFLSSAPFRTVSFFNPTYVIGQAAFAQVTTHLITQAYTSFTDWWNSKLPVNHNVSLSEKVSAILTKQSLKSQMKTLQELSVTLQELNLQTPGAQHLTSWLCDTISEHQAEGARLLREPFVSHEAERDFAESVTTVTKDVERLLKSGESRRERKRIWA